MSKKPAIPAVFLAVFVAALALLVSACFSPWQGEEATLTISVGDSSSRTLVNLGANEQASFSYELIMNGPGGKKTFTFDPGATSLTVKVTPGEWQAEVRAIGSTTTLRAFGEWEGTVALGETTTAAVTMYSASEVTSWAQLEAAVDGSPAGGNRKEIIFLKGGGTWGLDSTNQTINIERPIELRAVEVVTIIRNSADSFLQNFFYLNVGGVLTLKGPLTLDGNNVTAPLANSSFIQVEGKLEMYDGVTLRNNTIGSGVYVSGSGTFNMYGGSISRNKTGTYGGGVCVSGSGTFNMYGGSISGNVADSVVRYGGGVAVTSSAATFTKTGNSIIYGSNGDGNANTTANTTGNGHAVGLNENGGNEPTHYRNTTAGFGVNLDSRVAGSAGGWED